MKVFEKEFLQALMAKTGMQVVYAEEILHEFKEVFVDDPHGLKEHLAMVMQAETYCMLMADWTVDAYQALVNLGVSVGVLKALKSEIPREVYLGLTWTLSDLPKFSRNARKNVAKSWRQDQELGAATALENLFHTLSRVTAVSLNDWLAHPEVPFKQVTSVAEMREWGVKMDLCLDQKMSYAWDCSAGTGVLTPIDWQGTTIMVFWKRDANGKWAIAEAEGYYKKAVSPEVKLQIQAML